MWLVLSQHVAITFAQDPDAAYILTEANPEDRKPLDSISQLGNALCAEKLPSASKVRIVYPKAKCKMLDQEVVIIDSPGEFSFFKET